MIYQPASQPAQNSCQLLGKSNPKKLATAIAMALSLSQPLYAGNITAGGNDDGTGGTAGSLSKAILQANTTPGADTITLTTDVTINGVMKTLINSDITIQSDSTHRTVTSTKGRPFFVKSGTVTFQNLTISSGKAQGGSAGSSGGGAGLGGGLFVYDGTVTLDTVTFSSNSAGGGSSGGFGSGGGMYGSGGLFGSGYGGNKNYGGGVGANNTTGGDGTSGGFGGDGGFSSSANGGSGGFGGGGGYGAKSGNGPTAVAVASVVVVDMAPKVATVATVVSAVVVDTATVARVATAALGAAAVRTALPVVMAVLAVVTLTQPLAAAGRVLAGRYLCGLVPLPSKKSLSRATRPRPARAQLLLVKPKAVPSF